MSEPLEDIHFPRWLTEYEALRHKAGLVDFSQRTLIGIAGEDRAKFLHNFCTADILGLASGAGCEAFITSGQGRVLGYGYVFAESEQLVFETVPGQAEKLIAHLDHYLIREKVTLTDLSPAREELFIAGAQAAELLQRVAGAAPPSELLASDTLSLGDQSIRVRAVDLIGPNGWLLECQRGAGPELARRLLAAGAIPCGQDAFDATRIEAGSPMYGIDITDKNLPQEVGRDARAISFTKGCYLGQETVARIDALGHVNRTLVGVEFAGLPPAPGEKLLALDGEVVGTERVGEVTSSAWSPRLRMSLVLAYVRQGKNSPGERMAYRTDELIIAPTGDRKKIPPYKQIRSRAGVVVSLPLAD